MKLDLRKEYETLSNAAKETWKIKYHYVLKVASEENLNQEQTDALLQMEMAQLKYADLDMENVKLEDNPNIDSRKQISKNIVEMSKMRRIYDDNVLEVQDINYQEISQEVSNRTNQEIERLNKQSKQKNM